VGAPEGRLELTWANKHRRLLAHEDGSFEWVDPADYRVAAFRLLHDHSIVGTAADSAIVVKRVRSGPAQSPSSFYTSPSPSGTETTSPSHPTGTGIRVGTTTRTASCWSTPTNPVRPLLAERMAEPTPVEARPCRGRLGSARTSESEQVFLCGDVQSVCTASLDQEACHDVDGHGQDHCAEDERQERMA